MAVKMAKNMRKWNEMITAEKKSEKLVDHKRSANMTIRKQRNRRRDWQDIIDFNLDCFSTVSDFSYSSSIILRFISAGQTRI